jgi:hypothetical protein
LSIPGKLEIDRASRQELDRWATLRDSTMQPHDILVEDLSTTGCKIILNLDLEVGTLVRVGISGAGARPAKIVRGSMPMFGVAFEEPISEAEVRRAAAADTVVAAEFVPPPAEEKKERPARPARRATDKPPAQPGAGGKAKRRVPIWVDIVALFLIFLFALHVWRQM